MRSLNRNPGMNVVPFIDVLLVLLAIVFVISNFIALGKIEVDLPKGVSASTIESTKYNIAITKEGEFYLDDAVVSKEVLSEQIKKFLADDVVIIISDKHSIYEDFVFVIDQLKLNKIDKISMAVRE